MRTDAITGRPTTLIRVRSNAGLGSVILPLRACGELPTIALALRPTVIARVPQAAVDRVRLGTSATGRGQIVEADAAATAADFMRMRSYVGRSRNQRRMLRRDIVPSHAAQRRVERRARHRMETDAIAGRPTMLIRVRSNAGLCTGVSTKCCLARVAVTTAPRKLLHHA